MSKKPLNISEEAAVQMPMKTVASLIALVAIGTWAYFGLHESLNQAKTRLELMNADVEANTEFRIKWPRGQMGSLPADSEQYMMLDYMYKSSSIMYCSESAGSDPICPRGHFILNSVFASTSAFISSNLV